MDYGTNVVCQSKPRHGQRPRFDVEASTTITRRHDHAAAREYAKSEEFSCGGSASPEDAVPGDEECPAWERGGRLSSSFRHLVRLAGTLPDAVQSPLFTAIAEQCADSYARVECDRILVVDEPPSVQPVSVM